MKLFLTRDVKQSECHWLDRDYPKGWIVYSYEGCTYGCVSDHGRAVTLVNGETPFFELPRDALSKGMPPLFRLPAGIISEAREHAAMHADFIAWMERQPLLWEAMNGHSADALCGYGRWDSSDYLQRHDVDDSAYAVSIFDIMNDISEFLPEGHMFGFSEGRIGIFECRITITEI